MCFKNDEHEAYFYDYFKKSGSRSMTLLAFNLFNGFTETKSSPIDLFASLDESNANVCIKAIKLRFNIGN